MRPPTAVQIVDATEGDRFQRLFPFHDTGPHQPACHPKKNHVCSTSRLCLPVQPPNDPPTGPGLDPPARPTEQVKVMVMVMVMVSS